MSLSAWAGLATGLESGLSGYLKIRQIQNQEERDRLAEERARLAEERALRQEETAKRAESRAVELHGYNVGSLADVAAERKQNLEPVYNISELVTAVPNLGSDERVKLFEMSSAAGWSPESKESRTRINEFKEKFLNAPETKTRIAELQLQAIDREIAQIKAATADDESPLGSAAAMSRVGQLEKAKRRLEVTDPVETAMYVRTEGEKKSGREEKAEERAAEKHATDQGQAPAKIEKSSEALALMESTDDPTLKARYERLYKTLKKDEVEKLGEAARIRAHETNLLRGTHEDAAERRQDERDKKARISAETANVNTFYKDLAKDLNAEIKERKESGLGENDQITGVNQRALRNLATHRERDIERVRQGLPPIGVQALEAWKTGETATPGPRTNLAGSQDKGTGNVNKPSAPKTTTGAKTARDPQGNLWELDANNNPVKMIREKQQPPAMTNKPVVPGSGKSAMGIDVGAVLRDKIGGGTPEQRLAILDRDLKAGVISPLAYEQYKRRILDDITSR